MSSKKDIDEAINALGPTNVHPIGKLNADGSMSLVIGGLEQTAKSLAEWQAAHFNELIAQGMDPSHAAVIVSFTQKPKEPK